MKGFVFRSFRANYPIYFLLLSTWIFCAEQVEGVILGHFYSLLEASFMLKSWGWGGVVGGLVAHEISVTSQRPNYPFPLDLTGTWPGACQYYFTPQVVSPTPCGGLYPVPLGRMSRQWQQLCQHWPVPGNMQTLDYRRWSAILSAQDNIVVSIIIINPSSAGDKNTIPALLAAT